MIYLRRMAGHTPLYLFFISGVRSYRLYRAATSRLCSGQKDSSVKAEQPGYRHGFLGFLGIATSIAKEPQAFPPVALIPISL